MADTGEDCRLEIVDSQQPLIGFAQLLVAFLELPNQKEFAAGQVCRIECGAQDRHVELVPRQGGHLGAE